MRIPGPEYSGRIARLHAELGILPGYGADRGFPLIPEASELESIGIDRYGRERHLIPEAASAGRAMVIACAADGATLDLISAFRSVEYQADLIRKKLAQGKPIEEILSVLAAPGYSEHHSGCALDIGSPGQDPCVEEFETTGEFRWLERNASRFGFSMSYPRENPHKIVYEPWHWAYRSAGSIS